MTWIEWPEWKPAEYYFVPATPPPPLSEIERKVLKRVREILADWRQWDDEDAHSSTKVRGDLARSTLRELSGLMESLECISADSQT